MKVQGLLITCSRWVSDPSLGRSKSSTGGTYDYTKSQTSSPTNRTFTISYGAGDVGGYRINETVTIAGFTFDNVQMGIANTSSPAFQGLPFIGLLGLGPQPTYCTMSTLALNY